MATATKEECYALRDRVLTFEKRFLKKLKKKVLALQKDPKLRADTEKEFKKMFVK